MDYDHILLEPEHRELLALVIEASRNVRREQREPFLVIRHRGGEFLHHGGLGSNNETYLGNVEALANEGLINFSSYRPSGNPSFNVTPLGFRYYEYMKQQIGEPVEQVQDELVSYIDSAPFKARYPNAYAKWHEAQNRLCVSESERELTTIGHLCREAMQEFADTLVTLHNLSDVDDDKAHTIARIRAVLAHRESHLGKTHKAFLKSLLSFWGAVSDLVQRQAHGAQRESEPLKWEDARRVAFQTLIVMYEIDRAMCGT